MRISKLKQAISMYTHMHIYRCIDRYRYRVSFQNLPSARLSKISSGALLEACTCGQPLNELVLGVYQRCAMLKKCPNKSQKQKSKDPAKHNFWYPPDLESWNQNVRSICFVILWAPRSTCTFSYQGCLGIDRRLSEQTQRQEIAQQRV